MAFVQNYLANLAGWWAGREPTRPLMFSYYVTHRCNLNCRYCCDGDGKRFAEDPVPELETADAKRLVTLLSRSGDTLDITGGEPLLRDDLEEILAEARSVGLRTVLNTKGIGLPERPDLLRHTDVLVLSLDTLEPRQLAKLMGRPPAVAEQVLAALEYALRACGRTGTKLVLAAVATPENLDQVAEVLEFAVARGLGFQLSPQIVGKDVDPLLRGNDRYRALIDRVIETKRSGGRVLGVVPYLRGIRDFGRFRCHPLLMPVIRPDGRLYYPCLEWKRAEISILEADGYLAALAAARARFGPLPPCEACCHIFCHMALSLLQEHPLAALGEMTHWRYLGPSPKETIA
jgi:MoaA/NifB/PqqE/SkfB family radical SAM enzyme